MSCVVWYIECKTKMLWLCFLLLCTLHCDNLVLSRSSEIKHASCSQMIRLHINQNPCRATLQKCSLFGRLVWSPVVRMSADVYQQIICISIDQGINERYRMSTGYIKTSLHKYPQGGWCNCHGCNGMDCDYFGTSRETIPNQVRV